MEKSIGREMRSLNNIIMRYLDNHSNKKTIDKITCTNAWIIGYLAERSGCDIYQKDLEKDFSITRSTTSRVIDLMEQKGLVVRETVSHDGRLKKLKLTSKALEIYETMKTDQDMMESVMSNGIDANELEVFFSCIEKMKMNLCSYRKEEEV